MSTQPLLQRSAPNKRIALPVRCACSLLRGRAPSRLGLSSPDLYIPAASSPKSSSPTSASCPLHLRLVGLLTRISDTHRRTFLSWLNFTVVLAGLSIGLLNFGDKVGKISAAMFTLVAMAVMIYALVTYHWRANAIRKRGSGPYDDRLGPTCLCLSLLGEHLCLCGLRNVQWLTASLLLHRTAAVIVNFVLRIID